MDLLAERYYWVKEFTTWDDSFEDYRCCKPTSFNDIAGKMDKTPQEVNRQIRGIERRLESRIIYILEKDKKESVVDINSKFGHILKQDENSFQLFLEKLEQLTNTGEMIKLPNGAFLRLSCVDTDK